MGRNVLLGGPLTARRGPLLCFFAGFLFCIALAGWSNAAFQSTDVGWQGCSQLVEIATQQFGSARVRPTSVLDYDELDPGDALLILAPRTALRFSALSAFLGRGGRVAIADDFGTADRLLQRFRMRRVDTPAAPLRRVGGNPDLPVATPAGARAQRHPLVRDLEGVCTNHASAFVADPGVELTPLLEIEAPGQPSALFAATGVIGRPELCGLQGGLAQEACGRLVAIGDPSIFINLMLSYPDNARFSRSLLDYLLEGDAWGERNGTLYVVSGHFQQRGGALDPQGAVGDVLVALREQVVQAWSDGLPVALSVALAVALILTLALWAASLVGRSHEPFQPRFAEQSSSLSLGRRASRAAVSSDFSSDRSLSMLEVKRHVEGALATALGVSPSLGWAELTRQARRLLSPAGASRLEQLSAPLHAAEQAVLSGKPLYVGEELLHGYGDAVKQLQSELCTVDWTPSAKRAV